MLYLDMDGVFADYAGQYDKLTGGNAATDKGKTRMERLKPFPHFYKDLPLCAGAMELWHFVKPYNPTFLSAASNFVVHSRDDKKAWVEEHFGVSGNRVIVVDYPADKKKYAHPGDILIDDSAQNCADWTKAGGIAIHHTSIASTISQLKTALKKDEGLMTFGEYISI